MGPTYLVSWIIIVIYLSAALNFWTQILLIMVDYILGIIM